MSTTNAWTTTKTATPSPASTATQASSFNHSRFVFHLDIAILSVVALFVLFALPHAVVRFTQLSEWTAGLWLRYVKPRSLIRLAIETKQHPITPLSPAYFSPTALPTPSSADAFMDMSDARSEKSFNASSDDHHYQYASRSNLLRNQSASSAHAKLLRNQSSSSGRVRRPQENAPMHMRSWSSMFPTIAFALQYSLRPGLSIGKAIILLAYSITVFYAIVYKCNIFTTPIRAGFVGISQLPLVVALATKNNVLGMLLGMGYEKLNYLHRYAGRLLVLAVDIHALGYIYAWSIAGTLNSHIAQPHPRAGFIALGAANLMAFFSTSFWRTKYYNLFLFTHVVGLIVLLGAVCLHSTPAVPYILITVAIYALDRVTRLVRTRYVTAYLSAVSELGMTRIEIPSINSGWRAGQHVRIRVLSRRMGLFGWAECHPFSIASVSKGEDGLVLMCKKTGTWTKRLYELARCVEYGEAGGAAQNTKILIEGPYGGSGHTMFGSFSGALFAAGGSGITFALGAVQDLIQKDLEGETRLKAIELVWSVQDPSHFVPLIPTFKALLAHRTYANLKIAVHYTQAGHAGTAIKALSGVSLPKNLTLVAGRPKLAQTLTEVIDQACALSMFKRGNRRRSISGATTSGPCGVIVGVCGPGGLADEVRNVVWGADPKRAQAVGGIELHEEVFGW